MADFRVTCAGSRFAANFTRLGFHPGFSLTYTLPRLIGQQKANLMFYTGRRIGGEQAVEWGLADVLVPLADVRKEAMELAKEIAECAPLAIMSTRETMRRGFADGAETATERELTEQDWTRKTEDFKEGIKSYAEKRAGQLEGSRCNGMGPGSSVAGKGPRIVTGQAPSGHRRGLLGDAGARRRRRSSSPTSTTLRGKDVVARITKAGGKAHYLQPRRARRGGVAGRDRRGREALRPARHHGRQCRHRHHGADRDNDARPTGRSSRRSTSTACSCRSSTPSRR